MPAARPARRTSRGPGWIGAFMVGAALCSGLVTFLVLAGMTPVLPTHDVVVWVLAINVLLVLVLVGVVAWEGWTIVRARREGAAAAGLHVRVVALFSLVAAAPAILVAIVASAILERGLDPWFTGSIKALMSNTVEIAQAYRDDQCRTLARETQLMAADLNRARVLYDADRKLFRDFLTSRATFLGFPVAMLVKPDGTILERVDIRTIPGVKGPSAEDLASANENEAICIVPRVGNLFSAVLRLTAHEGAVLFVTRPVDPRATEFPPVAEAGVAYYQALEEKRLGIQVAFASMFGLIALIVLLSAVWFGLNFANRLVAPIRRLIHATDQVATGNFYVQVPVRRNEGDLAHLGETFNKMTSELRRQHDGLTAASDLIDRRRRFMEAVLSGVSAGVIGIDAHGLITIVNPPAEALLDANRQDLLGQPIVSVLPEIAQLIEEAKLGRLRLAQQQIPISRMGRERTLNIRVTSEQARGEDKGFIVTLDDITDLVTAQRSSAWADVARRIAHEIKNPLTPIQLSAERIRRKYGKLITTDREVFDQCTNTIVRQVDDIKRMVDEFSSFARMPKPAIGAEDIVDTVRQIVFMMRIANPEISIVDDVPEAPIAARFDRRLLSQAVTNIIKNATEAIAAVPESERGKAEIRVAVRAEGGDVIIDVSDTGKGFPVEGRQRLLEPYMTTREGGTGLGLAIVGKILEDHGGRIELLDNPAGRGSLVRMRFPQNLEAEPGPSAASETQRVPA
ncbi:sensor histidine kinase NtrY-like [Enterovirga aerilata]|uniref:histidine kinase n=1 Tax=Enterovirga aerilata TaxID=2730920 RepID=A0A849I411_9HYPH|nr:PAS domain-containing sensor histidine kinase [Enterovirga sp. DB1703]NNM72098.1 PAS domain-containing sensor histidine kinase [Enterovirga sp. DB1703]